MNLKAIPMLVSGKNQLYANLLSAYEYQFKFKPGKEIVYTYKILQLTYPFYLQLQFIVLSSK